MLSLRYRKQSKRQEDGRRYLFDGKVGRPAGNDLIRYHLYFLCPYTKVRCVQRAGSVYTVKAVNRLVGVSFYLFTVHKALAILCTGISYNSALAFKIILQR